jgi:APA family basic amino acid/polyamine antiporter
VDLGSLRGVELQTHFFREALVLVAFAVLGFVARAPALKGLSFGVAALGVLLALLAGVSRTTFAMARNRELPAVLAAVHPRFGVPYLAELLVGAVVCVVVAVADLRGAIGFSSFAVLTYYAIANAAAWTQPDDQRRWPRWLQAVGLTGCTVLAFTLPLGSVVGGVIVLGVGAVSWWVRRMWQRGGTTDHAVDGKTDRKSD